MIELNNRFFNIRVIIIFNIGYFGKNWKYSIFVYRILLYFIECWLKSICLFNYGKIFCFTNNGSFVIVFLLVLAWLVLGDAIVYRSLILVFR